ncbi:hypothetical protein [Thermococcus paralvinellae]|uniref:hypothetical protein n=1 Tax=Thermococcus paralvinellae TaxID=582419 RepID=UPI0005B2D20C|nr:hypothetical protein [Thermococcus paralvinellae]
MEALERNLEKAATILALILIEEAKSFEPRTRTENTIFMLKWKKKKCLVVPSRLIYKRFNTKKEYHKFNALLQNAGVALYSRSVKILKDEELRKKPTLTSKDWVGENVRYIRAWYYDYEGVYNLIKNYIKDEELKDKALDVLLSLYTSSSRYSSTY